MSDGSKSKARPAKIERFLDRDDWIRAMLAADNKALPPAAKVITTLIALRLHIDSGQCNPSSQELGEGTNLSERHVRRVLAVIERSGWLSITRRIGCPHSFQLMDPGHMRSGVAGGDPGHLGPGPRTSDVRLTAEQRESGRGCASRPLSRAGAAVGKEVVLVGAGFEDLRAAWPRPWADDDAADRRAFEAATRQAGVEDIIAGAAPWAAAMEARYLPTLAKWLAAKGWEKPPPEKPSKKANGKYTTKPDLAKMMLAQEGGYIFDDDDGDPTEGRLQ